MAQQYAQSTAHAMLDAIETDLGASPKLKFYSGSKPANVATGASGTLLATLSLPADAFAAAASWAKAKTGTWSGVGVAAADIGYFRLTTSADVAKIQGSVTGTGGGGDMELDNINIAIGQTISVSTYSIPFPAGNQ